MYNLFLTCSKGLEEVCKNELIKMGVKNPKIDQGGLSFYGDKEVIYRVNLWSRVGVRLYIKIHQFDCYNPKILYRNIHDFDWSVHFKDDYTFAVSTTIVQSRMDHQKYAALVIKDAIVDQFRKKTGKRPSIDKIDPDLRIYLYLKNNRAALYLDSSGLPLHKRNYRRKMHKAALNEALAAGIVYLTGWDCQSPFYDPFCGSGTIPIEAALISKNIAPGLLGRKFDFQKWANYDANLWKSLIEEAKAKIIHRTPIIAGMDIRADSMALSRQSANIAGIEQNIKWKLSNLKNFRPESESGIIVCNPPYGQRIGEVEKLQELYKLIGDIFKTHFAGHTAFIFTGNIELAKSVGLQTSRKIPLMNSNIECRLLKYELYSGTRKKFK